MPTGEYEACQMTTYCRTYDSPVPIGYSGYNPTHRSPGSSKHRGQVDLKSPILEGIDPGRAGLIAEKDDNTLKIR